MLEGSSKANKMFLFFVAQHMLFLCVLLSWGFMNFLQFWERKARLWVGLPFVTA